ncbi:hypothetical protein ACHAXR_009994, partial [Thalassiosira sp. AJA248-18]
MGGMGLLIINNITKGGMNSDATTAVVHKPQRHDLRSRKNTLSSEDLASPMTSESDDDNGGIYCCAGNDHAVPKKKNANDAIIPDVGIANPSSQSNASDAKVMLSRRWVPKKGRISRDSIGRKQSLQSLKKSGVFSSFTMKNRSSNHSSQTSTSHLSSGQEESSSVCNSTNDFATLIQEFDEDEQFKQALEEERASTQQQQLHVVEGLPSTRRPSKRPSIVSSDGESLSEEPFLHNDLDIDTSPLNSKSMLANLSDAPTSTELANVAAVRAKEYINECVETVLDRKNWDNIPQYSKSELMIKKHLGKGSFSDAYEVSVMVAVEDDAENKLDVSDKDDLGRLIEAKFAGNPKKIIQEDKRDPTRNLHSSALAKLAGTPNEIIKEGEEDDLDKQIDVMFGSSNNNPTKTIPQEKGAAEKSEQDVQQARVRPRRSRRQTVDNGGHPGLGRGVAASFCIGTTTSNSTPKRKVTYAMKCLRPQIRSDVRQFIIGVEDLVHETALLASLDHPHIVKLHGRAISNSFRLSDGYFILLDKLEDTLEERLDSWKDDLRGKGVGSKSPPSFSQLKTACSLADALSYLHSKNIVFRDLKPANIGFDSMGVLKLFDFGFAFSVTKGLLYDICGTPRYMAPEVGLKRGYGIPADVHSFGILFWQICSLKQPFAHIMSAGELHESVWEKGLRPKLSRHWPS